MRTNIDLNDTLMKEASALTGITEKKALVEEALTVLIKVRKRKPLSALRGKISFRKGYDHKVTRG